jgi:hypothetical protein
VQPENGFQGKFCRNLRKGFEFIVQKQGATGLFGACACCALEDCISGNPRRITTRGHKSYGADTNSCTKTNKPAA